MAHDEQPTPIPAPEAKAPKAARAPRPEVAAARPGESLVDRIERAFAEADKANLRQTARALEKLIPQLRDPSARDRYFQALDLLPDLVAHEVRE